MRLGTLSNKWACLAFKEVMVSSGSHWKGVKGLGIKDAQDTDTLTAQPFLCSGVL